MSDLWENLRRSTTDVCVRPVKQDHVHYYKINPTKPPGILFSLQLFNERMEWADFFLSFPKMLKNALKHILGSF